MWIIYEFLLVLAFLCYLPKAVWRRRLPHRGWSMRLGRYPRQVTERLGGRSTIWVHAVSVGEVLAARPLLQQLSQTCPSDPLVLSAITPSGFDVAAAQAQQDGGVAVFFPLDLGWCVRRALDALRPRLLLLVESELWPLVIARAHARRIPIAVVNGRISARAFGRYRLARPWLGSMLRGVDLFLMQSQADADRVLALGAPAQRVHVIGSLKWDASLGARPSPQAIRDTSGRLGLADQAIVIVAGSTHRGEEEPLLRAFRDVRHTHPGARLIVAPRHLERLGEVEGLIRHQGFSPVRLSRMPGGSWEVAVIDALGQLPRYYGIASVVFIGGSLIPHGGQNPLEAASVGKPIIFGPSMHNFDAITHQLLAHHAARQLLSERELAPLLLELLADQARTAAMGRQAQTLTEQFQGATQRTLEALQPLLTQSSKHQIPNTKEAPITNTQAPNS